MQYLKQMIPDRVKLFLRRLVIKNPIYTAIDWRHRTATWQERSLPHFIIIGAQKAGTTSLHFYLSQHPQIQMALKKEIHYFDGGYGLDVDNYLKGEAWYRAHFPKRSKLAPSRITYEATPDYIFHPLAPKRIAQLIPDVKLVALLRNPTERAISNYFHRTRFGNEPLPIMEAMLAEEERTKAAITAQDYKTRNFKWYTYKARGRYAEQIKHYLEYFEMKNMLFLNSDLLFSDLNAALRKIYVFLEIDQDFIVQKTQKRHVSSNRTPVDPAVYEYLDDYFRPYNQEMYDLLGEDYGW
ncbi:MAG: sulfotransferase domain-containing protein [Chloroflexota bacterium]|nr:sulfotransferase domain-containing protein [Chloroflexota bacterium]